MSWSISVVDTPEKIVEHLESHIDSSGLTGQSKLEFEEAKPHLIGLVKQNFRSEKYATTYPNLGHQLVKVVANGSGSSSNGEQDYRNCQITIESIMQRY